MYVFVGVFPPENSEVAAGDEIDGDEGEDEGAEVLLRFLEGRRSHKQ